jgi:hypothetical protein
MLKFLSSKLLFRRLWTLYVDKAYCRAFLDHVAQATSATKKICTRLALSSAALAIGPVELQSTGPSRKSARPEGAEELLKRCYQIVR